MAQSSSSPYEGGEKAFFDTLQMQKDVNHRQDFCELYTAFRNQTLELKDTLRGRQLNVLMGAYEDAFFRYSPEEGIDPVYPGIAAVLMDELARRAGFTWRNSFGIFVEPKGPEFNESWTDVLLWGIDTYDLSVDWWARNIERLMEGTAYTQEWYDSSIILVGKQEKQSQTMKRKLTLSAYWNWMKPFSWQVWLTTGATVFLSGLVFQILEHMNGNRRDRKWFEWWSDNLFLSAVNATQAYEYGTPKGLPSKLFCFSMALWSLILTATYTANLASLLVENQLDEVIIIESIQEAAFFGYPICTWEGTNSDSYIAETFPEAIRKPKATLEEMYQGLHDGECVFAVEVIQQWLINQHVERFNPFCDLEWVGNGRVVSASAAGFATNTDVGFKCTGLIRDVINIYMEEMISDGFLSDAWEVENSLAKEIECDVFSAQQLLNAAASSGGEGRRRKLQVTKKRLEGAKQYTTSSSSTMGRRTLQQQYHNNDGLNGSHRRLKASSKSASSAGAIDGGGGSASQMELDAMLGTFIIHWVFMFIAIGMGIFKKYYREKYGRNIGFHIGGGQSTIKEGHHPHHGVGGSPSKIMTKEGLLLEEEEDNDDEQNGSSQQTEKISQTEKIDESAKDDLRWQLEDLLYSMKQSKATMVKEQEELQWKIDKLKGVLDGEGGNGNNSSRNRDDSLRSL